MRDPSNRQIHNPKDHEPVFDADIAVFPLGVKAPGFVSEKLFKPLDQLVPSNFSEKDLEELSTLIWSHKERPTTPYFDFFELEHLYNLAL
jgi:hypothetical protein